ncbi:MAG: hypothetical protein JW914_00315 [Syntrophaceae bacterium]|nr:hypothetical protein [Syntrophaceae bacterium]
MTITIPCTFKNRHYFVLGDSYGKFRGKGNLIISDKEIIVSGKRLYSVAIRFVIHLIIITLLVLYFALFTVEGLTIKTLRDISFIYLFLLGMILSAIYNFLLLKQETLILNWDQIFKYKIDEKKNTIGFMLEKNSAVSPIVLQSDEFTNIVTAFRDKIPARESTAKGVFGTLDEIATWSEKIKEK